VRARRQQDGARRAVHVCPFGRSRKWTDGRNRRVPLHPAARAHREALHVDDAAERQPRVRLRIDRVSVRGRSGNSRGPAGAGRRALRYTIMATLTVENEYLKLRAEFVAMPGLCLTVKQVARLLDVDRRSA